MTAKQYLNRGYYIDLRIKHLEEQLEKTQNSLLSVQKYNSIKVQTSKKNSTEELHIKLLSYKEELSWISFMILSRKYLR